MGNSPGIHLEDLRETWSLPAGETSPTATWWWNRVLLAASAAANRSGQWGDSSTAC